MIQVVNKTKTDKQIQKSGEISTTLILSAILILVTGIIVGSPALLGHSLSSYKLNGLDYVVIAGVVVILFKK